MEILLGIILSVLLEFGLEAGLNEKVPKWLKYPILIFSILCHIGIIAILLLVGIACFKACFIISLVLFGLDIVFIIISICRLRNVYKKRNRIHYKRFKKLL